MLHEWSGGPEWSASGPEPLAGPVVRWSTPFRGTTHPDHSPGDQTSGPVVPRRERFGSAQPKTEKPPENSCEVLACRVHECIGSTAHRMCNPLKGCRFAGCSALSVPVMGNFVVVPGRGRHGVSSTWEVSWA